MPFNFVLPLDVYDAPTHKDKQKLGGPFFMLWFIDVHIHSRVLVNQQRKRTDGELLMHPFHFRNKTKQFETPEAREKLGQKHTFPLIMPCAYHITN